MLVGQLFVFGQLFVVAVIGVGNFEIFFNIHGDAHGALGDGAEDAPGQQRFDGPRKVVVQAGNGNIGAGVGKVDGPQCAVFKNGLAGVEVPAEKGVDDLGDDASLAPFVRAEKIVVNLVAAMHRLGGVVMQADDLRPDGQRAHKNVKIIQPGLQVHQHLAGGVVSLH